MKRFALANTVANIKKLFWHNLGPLMVYCLKFRLRLCR